MKRLPNTTKGQLTSIHLAMQKERAIMPRRQRDTRHTLPCIGYFANVCLRFRAPSPKCYLTSTVTQMASCWMASVRFTFHRTCPPSCSSLGIPFIKSVKVGEKVKVHGVKPRSVDLLIQRGTRAPSYAVGVCLCQRSLQFTQDR
jgi:hypothetical protein